MNYDRRLKVVSLAMCLLYKQFVGVRGYVARRAHKQKMHTDAVASVQATAALYNMLGFPEHHAMELFVEYRP